MAKFHRDYEQLGMHPPALVSEFYQKTFSWARYEGSALGGGTGKGYPWVWNNSTGKIEFDFSRLSTGLADGDLVGGQLSQWQVHNSLSSGIFDEGWSAEARIQETAHFRVCNDRTENGIFGCSGRASLRTSFQCAKCTSSGRDERDKNDPPRDTTGFVSSVPCARDDDPDHTGGVQLLASNLAQQNTDGSVVETTIGDYSWTMQIFGDFDHTTGSLLEAHDNCTLGIDVSDVFEEFGFPVPNQALGKDFFDSAVGTDSLIEKEELWAAYKLLLQDDPVLRNIDIDGPDYGYNKFKTTVFDKLKVAAYRISGVDPYGLYHANFVTIADFEAYTQNSCAAGSHRKMRSGTRPVVAVKIPNKIIQGLSSPDYGNLLCTHVRGESNNTAGHIVALGEKRDKYGFARTFRANLPLSGQRYTSESRDEIQAQLDTLNISAIFDGYTVLEEAPTGRVVTGKIQSSPIAFGAVGAEVALMPKVHRFTVKDIVMCRLDLVASYFDSLTSSPSAHCPVGQVPDGASHARVPRTRPTRARASQCNLCLLYTSPRPRARSTARMPSSA